MTISAARITHTTDVPVQSWKYQDLIQSFVYAQDPTTGHEYVFCSQARGSDGDVQNTYFHRHRLVGTKLSYMDTMWATRFGHMQTFHVRISAAGNPWIWSGVEQYDYRKNHVGTRLARYRYRAGTISSQSQDFTYVDVDAGQPTHGTQADAGNTVSAISHPNLPTGQRQKLVLRRAQSDSETYFECWEDDLLNDHFAPLRHLTVDKTNSVFQGACANSSSVFTVTGVTDHVQHVYQHDWSGHAGGSKDISNLNSPTGPNTSDEPEGLSVLRDTLHVGKRYNSAERRVYSLFGLHW